MATTGSCCAYLPPSQYVAYSILVFVCSLINYENESDLAGLLTVFGHDQRLEGVEFFSNAYEFSFQAVLYCHYPLTAFQ